MEISGPVAAILMASGVSERFGERDKLLVPFRGKPLARYTLELAAALDLPEENPGPTGQGFYGSWSRRGFGGGIFFVVSSNDVASLAVDLNGVTVIKNTAPEKGLRESVRMGMEVAGPGAEYYLFFPCDMPILDAATVRRVLAVREPGCIVEPRYRNRPGNPCLFSAAFREELLSLKEDETPRLIKARYPEALKVVDVSDALILEDVDDEETLKWLEEAVADKE